MGRFAALLLLLPACGPPAPPRVIPADSSEARGPFPPAPADTDAIMLTRGACTGHNRCATYTLGITSNGNVHFVGGGFTHRVGYAFDRISPDDVAKLRAFLDAHHFDALPTLLPSSAYDVQSSSIIVRRAGVTKEVQFDASTADPDAPAIANEIDRVASSAKWIGRNAPRPTENQPAIPDAALAAMLGPQRPSVQRCGHDMTIGITIDREGRAVLGLTSATDMDYKCMKKAVEALVFPLAGWADWLHGHLQFYDSGRAKPL